MKNQSSRNAIIQLSALLLIAVFSACVPTSVTTAEELDETTLTAEPPTITPTLAPTATEPNPALIFVQGEDVDPALLSQMQSEVAVLAEESGFALVSEEVLQPEMLTPNVQVVVGVGSGLNLNGLAPSFPDVTFISIDNLDVIPNDNMFVIGDPSLQQGQAFLAGYLGAVISSDYKVAGLFSSEAAPDMVNAFVIGAEYFCGICRPSYPPYNTFPYWDFLAPGSTVNGFQSVVDSLVAYGVEVLYLHGDLVSSELLSYLGEVGMKVISDAPPDMARTNWVGTVAPDYGAALADLWEDILSGAAGVQISAPFILRDTDAGLVSEGRLRLFEEMAEDLNAGLVSTQYVP